MTAENPIKLVLFCGGRGSATIIRALLRRPEISLTLIVNGYDDGMSTGALRHFIPGMLGPSDFRKNLSQLLGTWSHGQYALKNLMEYRLPESTGPNDIAALAEFARNGQAMCLPDPLHGWFAQLPPQASLRTRTLLARFFDHAENAKTGFDYRDCSLGNLVFAGAYLQAGNDFNAAAAEIGDLVGSQACLLNVSGVHNRFLVGLKQDGTFLSCEAEIVGPQSPAPIRALYFLEKPLEAAEISALAALDQEAKVAYLAARDSVPHLSESAAVALSEADIILYGPGTQHSSLLPSYRIARAALASAPAAVKAMVVNLDSDHDIQGLSSRDLVDRTLAYGGIVTHILLNEREEGTTSIEGMDYRGAHILRGSFATQGRPQVHNGGAIADVVLQIWNRIGRNAAESSVKIFADIHNRSVASDELTEEFQEMDWQGRSVSLVLNKVVHGNFPDGISSGVQDGLFPEATHLRDWLLRGGSDYLVLMTGDGAYRFQDVLTMVRLLEQQPSLGGVFGSRTQSRRQFITSIQAAYGEHRFLYRLGKAAGFFLCLLFYLRTGVIFSDPLTGLRIFRRRHLVPISDALLRSNDAPLAIARILIRNGVEVAELPILYRTFSGFTDPYWRVRRGLRNLVSLLGWT